MKKAFFAGIAVLVALAMISCDLFPEKGVVDNSTKPELTTVDGLPGVWLSIGVSGNASRALTDDNAQTYTDFYEVSFKGPNGKIYRATWRAGQKGRIAVPVGDYAATDPSVSGIPAAILFAGKYSDHTLLGVGKLTDVNGGPGTEIDSETYSVTFTLEPLKNDVKSTTGTTFEITTIGADTPADVQIKSDGGTITIPLFPVISGASNTANTATWTVTCPNSDGVIIQDEGTLDSVGVLTDAPIGGFKIIGVAITEDSGAISAMTSAGVFNLSFQVPPTEGLSSLFIDIPVCALDITPTTFPEIWHIRGGLRNYEFDQGTAPASNYTLGGAILIGTQAFAGPFEVNGTY